MCVLHFISKTDSFKIFASKTALKKPFVVDKNDLRNISKKEKWGIYRFTVTVSNKDFSKSYLQYKDSIKYLSKYKSEIKKLITNHNISYGYLDFGISSRIGNNVAIQNEFIPYELISLCSELKISINISLYDL